MHKFNKRHLNFGFINLSFTQPPLVNPQPFPRERGHKTREILKNYESSVSMHAKQPNEKRESDYTSE